SGRCTLQLFADRARRREGRAQSEIRAAAPLRFVCRDQGDAADDARAAAVMLGGGARASVAGAALLAVAACVADRSDPGDPPVYREDVARVMGDRCASCHAGANAAGGWRAGSYLDAIACVAGGAPATLPADERAPVVRALEDATHAAIARDARARVVAWVL